MKDKQKKWDAASRAQRRVMVAEDVLAQIKLGQITPEHGTYLHAYPGENCDGDIESLIDSKRCDACAIGSIFYSRATNYGVCENKTSVYVEGGRVLSVDDDEMINAMSDAFSDDELRIIEHAFEGTQVGWHPLDDDQCDALEKFHNLRNNAETRLKAIMKNIIKNKGDFKP